MNNSQAKRYAGNVAVNAVKTFFILYLTVVPRWNMDNTFMRANPAGNLKVDKEKSVVKVNGAAVLFMTLDRSQYNPITGSSVYDGRSLFVWWCALHGQQLGGVSPLRAWQQGALAEGKGVRREAESEGSWMSGEGYKPGGQSPGLTNRNRI